MPLAEHVKVIEGVARHFNAGALDRLGEFLSPALGGFQRDLATWRLAFPDAVFKIDDMIGEGNKVVDRFTITGTHLGSFAGVKPTGRRVAVAGITMVTIEGGRIVERWGLTDQLGLLRQLGALPAGLSGR